MAGLRPDAIVLVATIQALKYNGGVARADLKQENVEALEKGLVNLARHIENIQKYEVPVVVSLNSFVSDTDAENAVVEKFCREHNCEFSKATVWADGGAGGIDLAEKVIRSIEEKENNFHQIYDLDKTLQEKIETIAAEIYGAGKVKFTANARKQLQVLEDRGFGGMPVCIAKTQYSLSDNPKVLGRPDGFTLTVRDAYVSAGAGFVVVMTGEIMSMPGLPRVPAAVNIDVNGNGDITGLF